MIRTFAPILIGALAPFSLFAEEPAPVQVAFHSIPVVMDASGKFMLTKASAGGKPLHLLIDSGAHLEVSVSRNWAKTQGLEMKKLGDSVGIAGKNETFTTTLSDLEIGKAFKFQDLTAHVIDLPGKIRFEPDSDGTTPVEEGLLGGTYLMKSSTIISYLDKRMLAPGPKVPAGAYLKAAQAKGSIIVPLVKTATGAPYVEVKLGGKDWLFLVDTAAGSNIIQPEIAKELGLKALELEQKVTGVGGETTGSKMTFAENFDLAGKLVLPKLDLLIMPCPTIPGLPEGKRFAGIIGNSFLSQLQAEMDFGTYNLIFPASIARNADSTPKIPEGAAVIKGSSAGEALENAINQFFRIDPLTKSKDGRYFVRVQINGKDRWMAFDSGVDGVYVGNDIAKEDGIELTPGGTAKDRDGKPITYSNGVLKTFKIGSVAFDGAPVSFSDLSAIAEFTLPDGTKQRCAGQVGTAYIRGIPVVVDFPKSRLLISKSKIKGGILGIQKQLGFESAPLVDDEKGHHYLQTEVMGKKGLLFIDTGATTSTLYDNAAKSCGLQITQRKEGGRSSTINGFKTGDLILQASVEMVVVPAPEAETVSGLPVIGRVGSAFFEANQSTVDFSNHEVSISKSLIKK